MTKVIAMLRPKTPEEAAAFLKKHQGEHKPLSLYEHEAMDMDNPVRLDLSALNGILKYNPADLTLKAQTGITMGELYAETKKHGQGFALSYPPETLLIDVLAEDRPAPETGVLGYPRDFVLGLEIVTPDGEITKCGGEVVKNVTGYDLAKLYVGSRNVLGVITSVVLKLSGLPEDSRTFCVSVEIEEGLKLAQALLASPLPLRACALVYEQKQWQLRVRFAGYATLVDAAEKTLAAMLGDDVAPVLTNDAMMLEKTTGALLAEWAYPPGEAAGFESLRRLAPMPDNIWLNPAAGLIRAAWQTVSLSTTEALVRGLREQAHEMHIAGGFVQLLTFPAVPQFQNLAVELNLPPDEVNRQLMKRFKSLYDPGAILYSRVLVL